MKRKYWRKKKNPVSFTLSFQYIAYVMLMKLSFFQSILNLPINSNCVSLRKGISYSNNWVLDPYGAYSFYKHGKSNNCPLCLFKPNDWKGDSHTSDAIITFCFDQITSITPFIRMLRTVQCKAKLFILSDSIAYLRLQRYIFAKYFRDCDVVVINCGDFIGNITNRWSLYQMKTFVYRDFLHSYFHIFNRVLFCDMADTLFQSDPFKDFMNENCVFNYIENLTIYEEIETYDDIFKKLKIAVDDDNFIVTPAVYFGKPVEVLKLLDLVQSFFFDDKGENTELVDQSVVNVIYYKKLYEKYHINMRVVDWNSGILSANLNEFSSFELGNITCLNCEKQPFLIHHSNYITEFIESTYSSCPRLKNQKPYRYLSNLPESIRRRIDKEHAEKTRVNKMLIRLAKEARRRGNLK